MTVFKQQAAATKDFLVGTWKMLSAIREIVGTGEKSEWFGAEAKGYLSYSSEGRMIVFIVRGDRKTPRASVPIDEERIELYNSMLSFAGTYTVDGDKVIHHIDMSWNQAWTGTDQTRFYKLDGKTLTLRAAPRKDQQDGQESVYTLVWEKMG